MSAPQSTSPTTGTAPANDGKPANADAKAKPEAVAAGSEADKKDVVIMIDDSVGALLDTPGRKVVDAVVSKIVRNMVDYLDATSNYDVDRIGPIPTPDSK